MIALREQLFEELCTLVADLGKDGGLISPSVYDTAQVLRLYPPVEGVEPGLDWLVSQQKADGGWGDSAVPTARDVPTLAAILTIFTYRRDRVSRQIVNAGLEFLEQQASQWTNAHIDAVPIAAEMILPYLIKEASKAGLYIDRKPYARLFHLREKKLLHIRQEKLMAGTAPTYSWEALELEATERLLDGSGGVGHSPAATAAWLVSAKQSAHLHQYVPIATRYLQDAGLATGADIPGVVPNVFPITGFELSYGLYALEITGLNQSPELATPISFQSRELLQTLSQCGGVSFGVFFAPDVDSTAVSTVALRGLGFDVEPDYIWRFHNQGYFYTFPNELNPSILSNSHALSGLNYCGTLSRTTEQFLLDRQRADGIWHPDKWHSSWRYAALEATLPLLSLGHREFSSGVMNAFIRDQHPDGGWGSTGTSSSLETAYSLLTLKHLYNNGIMNVQGRQPLEYGYRYLRANLGVLRDSYPSWLGKELYSPYRVDRIYTLSTILSLMQLPSLELGEYSYA